MSEVLSVVERKWRVNLFFAYTVLWWGIDQLEEEEVDGLLESVRRCLEAAEGVGRGAPLRERGSTAQKL
ncbi:MAG: hypothetical protein QXK12_08705 [Candidatus Nezhaarchaeales archaeon]